MSDRIHWNPIQDVIDMLRQVCGVLERNIRRIDTTFFLIAKYLPIPTTHPFRDRGYNLKFARKKLALIQQNLEKLDQKNTPHILANIDQPTLAARHTQLRHECESMAQFLVDLHRSLEELRQAQLRKHWLITRYIIGPGKGNTETAIEAYPATMWKKLADAQADIAAVMSRLPPPQPERTFIPQAHLDARRLEAHESVETPVPSAPFAASSPPPYDSVKFGKYG